MSSRTWCTSGGRWYVQAHCHLRGGVRRFRVDRIQRLDDTGERFEPVRADPPAGIFDPGPGATDVVIDLPVSARWVVEAYPLEWEEADGRLTVHIHLLGIAWLERLLLRVGPEARVIEPPELRELGRNAARRLLRGYRSSLPAQPDNGTVAADDPQRWHQ